MLTRAAARTTTTLVSKRGFTSTAAVRNHYHWPEGPYTNLPFKVHGRKFVPFWVLHWGFFAAGLGAPFAIVYYNLKKSS